MFATDKADKIKSHPATEAIACSVNADKTLDNLFLKLLLGSYWLYSFSC